MYRLIYNYTVKAPSKECMQQLRKQPIIITEIWYRSRSSSPHGRNRRFFFVVTIVTVTIRRRTPFLLNCATPMGRTAPILRRWLQLLLLIPNHRRFPTIQPEVKQHTRSLRWPQLRLYTAINKSRRFRTWGTKVPGDSTPIHHRLR